MDYERLVQDLLDRSLVFLRTEPTQFEHWRLQLLPDWVGDTLPLMHPEHWISFIRDHKAYSFVYADAFGKVCGKPREIAAYLLTELITELVEEKR
jgi:hypothetical protein